MFGCGRVFNFGVLTEGTNLGSVGRQASDLLRAREERSHSHL